MFVLVAMLGTLNQLYLHMISVWGTRSGVNLLSPSILLYKGVLGTHTTTPASPVSGAVGHTHNPRILESDTRKCLSQEHKDYLNENLVSLCSFICYMCTAVCGLSQSCLHCCAYTGLFQFYLAVWHVYCIVVCILACLFQLYIATLTCLLCCYMYTGLFISVISTWR